MQALKGAKLLLLLASSQYFTCAESAVVTRVNNGTSSIFDPQTMVARLDNPVWAFMVTVYNNTPIPTQAF